MAETVLDYDKMIWTVFSVGVVSSVIILYYVAQEIIKDFVIKLMALSLGFSILVYCFFAILGYGIKKKETIRTFRNDLSYHPGYDEYFFVGRRLENRPYFRVRWIGETILFIIGVYYGIIFFNVWGISGVFLAIIITLLFAFLSCLANLGGI